MGQIYISQQKRKKGASCKLIVETKPYTFTKAAYDPASYEHTLKLDIAEQEAWSADDSIEHGR